MRATSRMVSASMPQTSAIFSGGKSLIRSFSSSKPSVWAWMYCRSVKPSSMMVCSMAFNSATSRPGVNRSMWVA